MPALASVDPLGSNGFETATVFGQSRPVEVHIFASEREGAVVANLKRKEHDAIAMADALSEETLAAVRENVIGSSREHNPYIPSARVIVPPFMEAA